MNRLYKKYLDEIRPQLQKELKVDNVMATPKIQKIILNVGITGEQNQKAAIDNMAEQLMVITGQKPKITSARQSIAGFKLRAGDPIGVAVTLRGERMYQFLDKLINIALPRVKDFQGVPTDAFDAVGNYSLGLKEQIVFPEINYDKIDKVRGLQIVIVGTGNNPAEGRRLLELFGMPFKKEEQN